MRRGRAGAHDADANNVDGTIDSAGYVLNRVHVFC